MGILPANFNFDALVGREVEMISVTATTINVHFGNRDSITMDGRLDLSDKEGHNIGSDVKDSLTRSNLMRLITQAIIGVRVEGIDTLELIFSSGDKLRLSATYGYESYHIQFGGREIHV